jgi:hypothetical protein
VSVISEQKLDTKQIGVFVFVFCSFCYWKAPTGIVCVDKTQKITYETDNEPAKIVSEFVCLCF